MSHIVTKEEQLFFLNSGQLRGVQNVSLDHSAGAGLIKYIGFGGAIRLPTKPQVGQLNLSYFLISQDPFIDYMWSGSFNGYILNNKNSNSTNYSFTSGYLTSYSSRGSVGEVPQVSIQANIYGDLGQLEVSSANDLGLITGGTGISPLQIVGPGSIRVLTSDFNTDKVVAYDLSYTANRRADYCLGSRYPTRVKLVPPVEVAVKITMPAKDFSSFNLKDYPGESRETDMTIMVNDFFTNSRIVWYSLEELFLDGQTYSTDVEGQSLITLSYQGLI